MDTAMAGVSDDDAGFAIVGASGTAAATKYLSCRYIERGIVFQPARVITPCCVNPANGLSPELVPFNGGSFSIDAMLEARAQLIKRHKAGDIAKECQGCPRLTEAEWNTEQMGEYAIDEVTIAHFTSCNIRCNYCYTVTRPEWNAPLSKAPRLLPIFQQLIDRKLLAPYATVKFSGGEPTLSPEFEPLLMLLNNYGVSSIVYTNATKRSDAIIDALKRDKVELICGIDAASIKTYKAIKKMNYHDKVWKVLAEYCAALPSDAVNKVWAKFIFCLENYQEAEHFVHLAAAAGAKHVYYDLDSSRVEGRVAHADNSVLPEIITDYIAVLRHECEKQGVTVDFAQSGLVWLTPERVRRIEREIERLRQLPDDMSYLTDYTPQLFDWAPGNPYSKSDFLKTALIAAQAGLIWLSPERTHQMASELAAFGQTNAVDAHVLQ
jgi:organic radical activating enzyme